jgi:hypothetical protein
MAANGLDQARDIKALGLKVLKAKTAAERMEALLAIRRYNHPIVLDVLAQAQKDRDAGVRDLATNLHRKKQLDWAQNPPQMPTAPPKTTRGWVCRFCGSENASPAATTCPQCGATRSSTDSTTQVTSGQKHAPEAVFLLDPDNKPFLQGKRRPSSIAWFPTIILGIMVVAGLLFVVFALREFVVYFQLTQGTVTTAEISQRDIDDEGDSTSYSVHFRYQVAGEGYETRQIVSRDVYNRTEVGSRVEVIYAPSDPATAKMNGTNEPPWLLTGFVFCWNGFILTIVISLVMHYLKRSRLLREGKLLYGEIVKATFRTDDDNDVHVTVEYGFAAPGTQNWLTGQQSAIRNDLRKALPEQGTPVAVLYLDAHRHMLC